MNKALKIGETSIKDNETRYTTKLPLRERLNQLLNNCMITLGQLYSLEKCLNGNPDLKTIFSKPIETDLEKGDVIHLHQAALAKRSVICRTTQ